MSTTPSLTARGPSMGASQPPVHLPKAASRTRKGSQPRRDPAEAAQAKAHMARDLASAQAEALAGHRVRLALDEAREAILLDAHGRELHAGPGEGLHLRASALLLLEAEHTFAVTGQDQERERVFGLAVSGYRPALRYAPGYQRRLSAEARKVARKAMALVERRLQAVRVDWTQPGGKVQPVAWTLTTPTLDPGIVPGVSEVEEERRLLMAWGLLRKLDLFKASVFACFRGFEVTRKSFSDGVVLHHPHFHVLAWARYVPQADLAVAWWACLRTATRRVYRFDLDDLYPAPEALARAVSACAYVQAVRKRTRRKAALHDDLGHVEGPLSLEDALQECMKYMTKASDIACYAPDPEHPGERIVVGLPQEYLAQGVWRRSARVFERVGAARDRWTPPEWCQIVKPELLEASAPEEPSCSLDTQPITDGAEPEPESEPARRKGTLRDLMATLDLHRWLQVASRRALSATDHLTQALQKKGYAIPGATTPEPTGGEDA